MSAIDPLQHSRTNASQLSEPTSFDPAALLQMLSWKQLDVLQGSLSANISTTQKDFDSLGRIGDIKADVSQLKAQVHADELHEAEKLLPHFDRYSERITKAGSESVVVSDSDQRELKKLEEWARERGFSGSSLTLQQPVPKPPKAESEKADSKEKTEEADAPPEMQTVLNQAAYLEFRDALRGYISGLKTGNVDNPAIRSQFEKSPDYERLVGELKSLGLTDSLSTFDDVDRALKSLTHLADQVITRLEKQATNMQKLVAEVASSSSTFMSLSDEGRRAERAANDRKLDAQTKSLVSELDDSQRQRLEQVINTLRDAQAAQAQCESIRAAFEPPALTSPASDDLRAQLSKWESNLKSYLDLPSSTSQPEYRSIRSGKQFV